MRGQNCHFPAAIVPRKTRSTVASLDACKNPSRSVRMQHAARLGFGAVALGLLLLQNSPKILAQVPKPAAAAGANGAGTEAASAWNDLYKKSVEHFGRGEYAECVAGLNSLLEQGVEGPGVESIQFTIAAALFNLKEHSKALAAFEQYVAKFPNGEKIGDAQMSVGQCQVALGDKQAALVTFTELAARPSVNKEKAVWMRAALLRDTGQVEESLALLRQTVNGSLQSEDAVQQAFLLASMEASSGRGEAAIKILSYLMQRMSSVENPLQINALAFEVGDALLDRKSIREALRAYAMVKPKAEVIAWQRAKLEAMMRRHAANAEAARISPARAAEFHQANAAILNLFETGKKILEQASQVEDFAVSLRLRQARAYQELGRHWECVLLLENVLSGTASDAVREEVLYALVVSHSELKNTAEMESELARYQREFPKGKNAESIDFISGILKLEREDLNAAETIFTRMVGAYPKGEKAATTVFLLANTRFAATRYADALGAYADYNKRFPTGEFAEEARYRIALCHFFSGDYEKGHPALDAYVKEFPTGAFVGDALYRIAVCYQAAARYDEVIRRCVQWEKDYPENSLLAEVVALKGDALAGQNKREEAAAAYTRAMEANPDERVLGYVVMEANKQYQKLGRWDLSTQLFREFLQNHPGHAAEVEAVYWLSKCLAREGKHQEAREMLARKVAATIADRSRDAVEQILTQLAQLCAKRPPTANFSGADAPASAAYDPAAEMRGHLAGISSEDPLVRARLYFAEAELARLTRRATDAEVWMDKVADEIPVKSLGAALLAQTGDRFTQRGEGEKAKAVYAELMKAFPGSSLLEYAFNGMGQLELLAGRAEEALRWFEDAVKKTGAVSKLKDVTLGKAKALFGLGKMEEARVVFEQVAAAREWRGEATAESVFYLGQIAFEKHDYAAAVQFYQRVFVAYQRYPRIVAKSYLRAADCFEKMGEPQKALAHLREMVSREKLDGLSEVKKARERMEALIEK